MPRPSLIILWILWSCTAGSWGRRGEEEWRSAEEEWRKWEKVGGGSSTLRLNPVERRAVLKSSITRSRTDLSFLTASTHC